MWHESQEVLINKKRAVDFERFWDLWLERSNVTVGYATSSQGVKSIKNIF